MMLDVNALLAELSRERQTGVSTITLNLAGFVDDDELLEWLQERVVRLAEKYPCRSIFLDACHDQSTHQVRTARKDVNDDGTVRTEEVILGVNGIGAPELRSIVHGLTVPNVPTLLLWTGKHLANDARFEELVGIATSVVLDSSRLESTSAGLHELVSFIGTSGRENVQDLAYLRLRPWQDAVAQFFDDAELTAELPAISDVEIASGSEAEGYYLIGWLASRLGWKPCGTREFCNIEGNVIRLHFVREGQPRRVARVALQTPDTRFCAEIRPHATSVICSTITGRKERPQHCIPLPQLDMLSLVEQTILSTHSDQIFRDSLGMARTVFEHEDQS